jgi:hypothetical protein
MNDADYIRHRLMDDTFGTVDDAIEALDRIEYGAMLAKEEVDLAESEYRIVVAEVERLRSLLSLIVFELAHPMMDGSNVVRARKLADDAREKA